MPLDARVGKKALQAWGMATPAMKTGQEKALVRRLRSADRHGAWRLSRVHVGTGAPPSHSTRHRATTAAEAAVGKDALQAWGMATGRMMVLEHLVLDPHMGKTTRDSQEEEKQANGRESGVESARGVEGMRVGWEGERRVRVASSFRLEEAVAVVQHHDGITGTAQQHVTDDYSARLHRAAEEASAVLTAALAHLITRGTIPPPPYVPPSNLSSNLSLRAATVEFTFKEDSEEQPGWGFWNQVADGAEEGDEGEKEDEGEEGDEEDEEGKAGRLDKINELLYEVDRAGAVNEADEGDEEADEGGGGKHAARSRVKRVPHVEEETTSDPNEVFDPQALQPADPRAVQNGSADLKAVQSGAAGKVPGSDGANANSVGDGSRPDERRGREVRGEQSSRGRRRRRVKQGEGAKADEEEQQLPSLNLKMVCDDDGGGDMV
ncbi:unnamed protein product [Closterium sp. NIES-54]